MSRAAVPPEVSVVVPTYGSDDWLAAFLDDLTLQTLAPQRYEVVLVRNGPPTRTGEIVSEWLASHPDHQVRVVESAPAGVARATNAGFDAALGQYVCIVNDDDRIGPRHLEALLEAAGPETIPVTAIGIVQDWAFTAVDFDNFLTQPMVRGLARYGSAAILGIAAQAAVAKLLPTAVARTVRVQEGLAYGEDTAFWVAVVARTGRRFVAADLGPDAAYLYNVRSSGSLTSGTREGTWDGAVVAPLRAIGAVTRAATTPAAAQVAAVVIKNLIHPVRQALTADPSLVREAIEVAAQGGLDERWWHTNDLPAPAGQRG